MKRHIITGKCRERVTQLCDRRPNDYYAIPSLVSGHINYICAEDNKDYLAIAESDQLTVISMDLLEEIHDIYEDLADRKRMKLNLCTEKRTAHALNA